MIGLTYINAGLAGPVVNEFEADDGGLNVEDLKNGTLEDGDDHGGVVFTNPNESARVGISVGIVNAFGKFQIAVGMILLL